LPTLDRLPLPRGQDAFLRLITHEQATLQPNQAARFRLAALLGYGAGEPAEVAAAYAGLDDTQAAQLAVLVGTSWLLRADGVEGGIPRARLDPLPALPRARVVGAQTAEHTLSRVPELLRGGLDPMRRALVDPDAALFAGEPLLAPAARELAARLPQAGAGAATVRGFAAESVDVEVDAAGPALLVLAEGYFPGWRAWVDGVEAPIVRAEVLARGVPVPQGRHAVHFQFAQPAVQTGARVSGVALVALLALLWIDRRAKTR
jgi:hypothetical protein